MSQQEGPREPNSTRDKKNKADSNSTSNNFSLLFKKAIQALKNAFLALLNPIRNFAKKLFKNKTDQENSPPDTPQQTTHPEQPRTNEQEEARRRQEQEEQVARQQEEQRRQQEEQRRQQEEQRRQEREEQHRQEQEEQRRQEQIDRAAYQALQRQEKQAKEKAVQTAEKAALSATQQAATAKAAAKRAAQLLPSIEIASKTARETVEKQAAEKAALEAQKIAAEKAAAERAKAEKEATAKREKEAAEQAAHTEKLAAAAQRLEAHRVETQRRQEQEALTARQKAAVQKAQAAAESATIQAAAAEAAAKIADIAKSSTSNALSKANAAIEMEKWRKERAAEAAEKERKEKAEAAAKNEAIEMAETIVKEAEELVKILNTGELLIIMPQPKETDKYSSTLYNIRNQLNIAKHQLPHKDNPTQLDKWSTSQINLEMPKLQSLIERAKIEKQASDKAIIQAQAAQAEKKAAEKAKAEREAAEKARAKQEAAEKAKAEKEAADKAQAEKEAAETAALDAAVLAAQAIRDEAQELVSEKNDFIQDVTETQIYIDKIREIKSQLSTTWLPKKNDSTKKYTPNWEASKINSETSALKSLIDAAKTAKQSAEKASEARRIEVAQEAARQAAAKKAKEEEQEIERRKEINTRKESNRKARLDKLTKLEAPTYVGKPGEMSPIEKAIIAALEKIEEDKEESLEIKDQNEENFEHLIAEYQKISFGNSTKKFLNHTTMQLYFDEIKSSSSHFAYNFQFWMLIVHYSLQQPKSVRRSLYLKQIETALKKIRKEIYKPSGQGIFELDSNIIKNVYLSGDETLIKLFMENPSTKLPIPSIELFKGGPVPSVIQKRHDETQTGTVEYLKRMQPERPHIAAYTLFKQRRFRDKKRQQEESARLAGLKINDRSGKEKQLSSQEKQEIINNINKDLKNANIPYVPQKCNPDFAQVLVKTAEQVQLFDTIRHYTSGAYLNLILDEGLKGKKILLEQDRPFKRGALDSSDLEKGGDAAVVCFGVNEIVPQAIQSADSIQIMLDVNKIIHYKKTSTGETLNFGPSMFFKQRDFNFDTKKVHSISLGDECIYFTHGEFPPDSDFSSSSGYTNLQIKRNAQGGHQDFSALPKHLFMAYDCSKMHQILTLNFFRFIDTLQDEEYIKSIYASLEKLYKKEGEEGLRKKLTEIGTAMTQATEVDFYENYQFDDFSVMKGISKTFIFDSSILKKEGTTLSDLTKIQETFPNLFKNYYFLDYLLSRAGDKYPEAIQAELTRLRDACSKPANYSVNLSCNLEEIIKSIASPSENYEFAFLQWSWKVSKTFTLEIPQFILDLQDEKIAQAKLKEAQKIIPNLFKSYRFLDYLLSQPHVDKYPEAIQKELQTLHAACKKPVYHSMLPPPPLKPKK